jgi:hypothetical protein
MNQRLNRSIQAPGCDAASLIVDRLPTRTAAAWGITGPELTRLNDAVRFMELHCLPRRCGLWLASTAKASSRLLIADIWKRITRLQGAYGLRRYSVNTFESSGALHAHTIFLGSRAIAERLKASNQFGSLFDVQTIADPNGLVRKYLVKERTPQAGYRRGHILGGRIAGSHQLPGGGDRVRLSRELERDAIEAGYVEAWQHTNARRSPSRRTPQRGAYSSRSKDQVPSGGR